MQKFVPFVTTECPQCGLSVFSAASNMYTVRTEGTDPSVNPDICITVPCPDCGTKYTVTLSD